ncbi:hypothetical protein [Gluconobacter kanchanaburiensis]|uniref:Uncharacterized protein n=1 Tax=Gluconobacter kanchanaburiensis NBRC 103587 TaxID=1307948 RepID=A0A511B751_9PROT|nr:hypothetical protein [Gluconobacter kanchanaburiensis]MBF0861950.1 hypothetical protein [Gluconobacter kanchanaburiensis]GBR67744.1 hypothetical protein AA103587_0443 [Gluconobacter kanchanaburiensis NBRC 103587]GEK95523.1 hypothetical protein GKA01_07200 [Gluconobacter kanchanaburiensis NBRC 103587]
MKKILSLGLLCGLILASPIRAATTTTINGVFEKTVHAFSETYAPLGQIPASELMNQPVVGIDENRGLLKVQTARGIVLIAGAAVTTTKAAAAPRETACSYIATLSASSTGSSAGFADNCKPSGH